MPLTAHDIKLQLDNVVDAEGNVLNMAGVIEVVGILESFLMTKESLEATRIGRTINLIRKRTTSPALAKRAKKLLKKWQTLVTNHLQNAKPAIAAAQARALTPPVLGNEKTKALLQPGSADDVQPYSVVGAKRKGSELINRTKRKINRSESTPPTTGLLSSTDVSSSGNISLDDMYACIDKSDSHKTTQDLDLQYEKDLIAKPKDALFKEQGQEIIPPENLAPNRQPMPTRCLDSPTIEADGVNGTYDDYGQWRDWTSLVERRNGELVILPYVNLN